MKQTLLLTKINRLVSIIGIYKELMGLRILDFRSADSQTVSTLLDTHDKDLKKSGTCGLTITVPVFIYLTRFGVLMA